MTKTHKTIAVDFDGTLADDSRVKYPDLGPPIPAMVERVRGWIQDGHTVTIFTARLAEKDRDKERDQVKRLTEWLDLINLTQKDGRPLVLTATKLPEFDEFWDDKAIGVIRNTGSTYFEAEHYRDNYDPKSGMFGATKEESSRPRNESQLELQFGGSEDEQFTDNRIGGIYGLGTGVHAQTAAIEQGRKQNPRYVPVGLLGSTEDYLNRKYQAQLASQAQQASDAQSRVGDAGLCGGQSSLPSGTLRLDVANEGCAPYTAYITYKDLTDLDPREPYTR